MNKLAHHIGVIADSVEALGEGEFARTLGADGMSAVGLFEEGAVTLKRIVAGGMSALDAEMVARALNAGRLLARDSGAVLSR